jgi:hypothetical protein
MAGSAAVKSAYRRAVVCATAALGLFALRSDAAEAAPANTLKELWAQLGECLQTAEGAEGLDLTIVFSLQRDGALLGKPRITHSKSLSDADLRRAAVSLERAMNNCLPASITDALGGAIAGRPLALRVLGKRKEKDTDT